MEELHARVETHLKLRRLQVELEETNSRLERVNGRMSRDLEAAAKIQKTFLPSRGASNPGHRVRLVLPALRRTGRRWAEHYPARRWKVGLYILDVSGHGVSSALLSVTLSRLLSPPSEPSSILVRDRDVRRSSRSHAARGGRRPPEPALPVRHGDRAIRDADVRGPGRFDRRFPLCLRGHPGPIYLPAGGPPVILQSPGFPIGLAEEAYSRTPCPIGGGGPDVSLLRRTSRCDERRAANGSARLGSWTQSAAEGVEPLRKGIAMLLDEIARWQGGARAQDDISILAVEVTAVPKPDGPNLQHRTSPQAALPVTEPARLSAGRVTEKCRMRLDPDRDR